MPSYDFIAQIISRSWCLYSSWPKLAMEMACCPAWWHLKLLAIPLFVPQLYQANNNAIIKSLHQWPFVRSARYMSPYGAALPLWVNTVTRQLSISTVLALASTMAIISLMWSVKNSVRDVTCTSRSILRQTRSMAARRMMLGKPSCLMNTEYGTSKASFCWSRGIL